MTSPADIKVQVLAAGFDLSFLLSFVFGIVILVLALVVREEVHPDYRTGIRGRRARDGDDLTRNRLFFFLSRSFGLPGPGNFFFHPAWVPAAYLSRGGQPHVSLCSGS